MKEFSLGKGLLDTYCSVARHKIKMCFTFSAFFFQLLEKEEKMSIYLDLLQTVVQCDT